MLSAEADHAMVGRAIAEGASGYVGKEKPIVEIVEMLDRAVRGQLAVEPALLQRALRPQKSTEDPLWALQFLTDREWQVMRCIMEGQTTEEMAERPGGAAQHRADPRPEPADQARGPLPVAGCGTDVGPRFARRMAGAPALSLTRSRRAGPGRLRDVAGPVARRRAAAAPDRHVRGEITLLT